MWFEICELTKYNLSGLLKFNMLKSDHTVRHKLYDFFSTKVRNYLFSRANSELRNFQRFSLKLKVIYLCSPS